MVVKLEVIDAAFVLEQSAVVASGEVEGPMSLIDGPECVQKPSPARVRRHFQWRNAVPGLFDQLFGQQSAVFAERDEDDAVEQPLRRVDRLVVGESVVVDQGLDQALPLLAVVVVEFVADFALLLRRTL